MDLLKAGSIAGTTPSIGLDKEVNKNGNTVFSGFYKSALDMLEETNGLQKDADQMSMDFALGKIDNLHDVQIAQEKASIALQYTVQLRDSLMDAYNEIMRMQV